jgi:hypothetical protein
VYEFFKIPIHDILNEKIYTQDCINEKIPIQDCINEKIHTQDCLNENMHTQDCHINAKCYLQHYISQRTEWDVNL